ncbi:MAG: formate dehydrogenase subunit alpha [Candidatus Bathyarchaeia archaeon]
MEKVRTTCVYCGTGCSLYLKVRKGRVVGVIPDRDGIDQGKLCIKGWSIHEFVHSPLRLTKPLIRDEGRRFREVSWDLALSHVAKRLKAIRERYGSDAIGLFSSAKTTNEENYLMQKFARAVIGTNNVDHCARLCHASTVVGLISAFGSGAMTNSIDEIEDAEVIFVIGSNTTEQHPLIARRILRAVREKGSKLIVADPRAIDLVGFATIHLQHRPGTDVALLNGMMNVIISENLLDEEFIRGRTENFEALKEVVERYTPQLVEEITTVPASKIRDAARLYGSARTASLIYSMGITQHTTGVDNVISTANLAMLTGNVGRPSTGVNPLRGHNNVQGACDVGALPDFLPGYQRVGDEGHRRRFEGAWGRTLPTNPGLTIVEMINEGGKRIRALYIMGENPMVTDPDISHVRESLEKLDFLVVQDIFMSETAQLAGVILPAASFAEKDGTFTATDRRVLRVHKAIEPPGSARADWEIVSQLATEMGYPMSYGSPKQIMDEIAELAPIYGGISHERLEYQPLQWPCPTRDHPGTKYLHEGEFSRGLGRFIPVEYKPPAEQPDGEYPLILTTGRVLWHFHSGTLTRKSPTLTTQLSEGYVEISQDDATELGLSEGEEVKVVSRRGEITIKANITERVPRGIVFIPFHFAESAANFLTNPALDPRAEIPELKVCAVRIDKPK